MQRSFKSGTARGYREPVTWSLDACQPAGRGNVHVPLQLFELRSPFCMILTPILISTFAHLSKTKQKPSTLHSLRFLSVCRRKALSLISRLLEKNNTRPCGQAGRRATGPGETEARGRHRGAGLGWAGGPQSPPCPRRASALQGGLQGGQRALPARTGAWGCPQGSQGGRLSGEEPPPNAGDTGSIPGLAISTCRGAAAPLNQSD